MESRKTVVTAGVIAGLTIGFLSGLGLKDHIVKPKEPQIQWLCMDKEDPLHSFDLTGKVNNQNVTLHPCVEAGGKVQWIWRFKKEKEDGE